MAILGRNFPNNALLTAVPIILPVGYDAAGAGYTIVTAASSVSASETHTAASGAAVIAAVAVLGNPIGAAASFTRSATFGGTAMTSLSVINCNRSTYGWIELFGITNVAGGAQTVTASVTGSGTFAAAALNTVSFTNVGSFGTAITNASASTALASGSVTSGPRQRVVQAFAAVSTGTTASQSAYSQTSRWVQNLINVSGGGNSLNVTIGDAAGASTVSFSETVSATQYWGSIAIPLLPI